MQNRLEHLWFLLKTSTSDCWRCAAIAFCALVIAGCTNDVSFEETTELRKPLRVSGVVTSSTLESAEFPAAFAVDGDFTTRWSSAFSDPQWIQVDLGRVTAIDQIILHWEAAHARHYDIQMSADGSNWTTVFTNSNSDGGVDEISLNASGRFVRVYCRSRATPYGNSLWELQIFSPDGGSSERLLSASGSATASSTEVAELPAAAAVDGDLSTRWASGYSDPQWLTVDLGAVYKVNRVKLIWEAAFGSRYEIQASQDGRDWNTLRSVVAGDGGVDEFANLNTDARYVRMYGTARGTEWGYSLWEFEVYGSDDGPNPDCSSDAGCNDGNSCTLDTCRAGFCSHVDNGSCSPNADIEETFSNLSNWNQYIRSDGGSVTLTSNAQATDNAVASLKFPGNPSLGSGDAAGPGSATEIALRDEFLYGTFETRVRFSSCGPGEEVVDGIFTYFKDGSDWNGNGIADNSEIDIEFLCGTPHLLWLTVYTDFETFESGRLRKLSKMIDMRTGKYTVLVDWPPTVIEQGTIPGLSIPGFPGQDFYTVGFDWREGHVKYYMRHNGAKIALFDITDPSRVPHRAAEFLMNIWHSAGHWTDGSAADYPANDTNLLVDWVKIWR